jgi:hypothetical protein
MNYYLATKLERAEEARAVHFNLVSLDVGFKCTYDWTTHGSVKNTSRIRLAEVGLNETKGVLSADVVIVLLPGGRGTHAELGIAIGAGKRVILHSKTGNEFEVNDGTCAFYWQPLCERVVGDLTALVKYLAEPAVGMIVR